MAYNNTDNISNNQVFLSGRIVGEPTYSHTMFDEKFYEFKLAVKRTSGTEDILPICVSDYLLNGCLGDDDYISIKGQFRSYNKVVDDKNKLMLTIFAQDILTIDDKANPNVAEFTGYICKTPIYRKTPLDREICDLMIAVNRNYNKSDYIPCIVWGRNAKFASHLNVGEQVKITGRIQSREYQKNLPDNTVITKIAYEVSVSRIIVVE